MAEVVERQLLARARRRSGAARAGARRATGRPGGCSRPGAARRGGCARRTRPNRVIRGSSPAVHGRSGSPGAARRIVRNFRMREAARRPCRPAPGGRAAGPGCRTGCRASTNGTSEAEDDDADGAGGDVDDPLEADVAHAVHLADVEHQRRPLQLGDRELARATPRRTPVSGPHPDARPRAGRPTWATIVVVGHARPGRATTTLAPMRRRQVHQRAGRRRREAGPRRPVRWLSRAGRAAPGSPSSSSRRAVGLVVVGHEQRRGPALRPACARPWPDAVQNSDQAHEHHASRTPRTAGAGRRP